MDGYEGLFCAKSRIVQNLMKSRKIGEEEMTEEEQDVGVEGQEEEVVMGEGCVQINGNFLYFKIVFIF